MFLSSFSNNYPYYIYFQSICVCAINRFFFQNFTICPVKYTDCLPNRMLPKLLRPLYNRNPFVIVAEERIVQIRRHRVRLCADW